MICSRRCPIDGHITQVRDDEAAGARSERTLATRLMCNAPSFRSSRPYRGQASAACQVDLVRCQTHCDHGKHGFPSRNFRLSFVRPNVSGSWSWEVIDGRPALRLDSRRKNLPMTPRPLNICNLLHPFTGRDIHPAGDARRSVDVFKDKQKAAALGKAKPDCSWQKGQHDFYTEATM